MQNPGRPVVPSIDVQEAQRRVERGDAVIIDVREDEELAEVSVPGAIHVPLGELPNNIASLPEGKELLMFCRSGNRSAYATAYLQQAGIENVSNVEGGIISWVEAGLPCDFNQS